MSSQDLADTNGALVKGVIFNIIEEAVVSEHGDDAWDDLLERAGLEGAYTALGHYDDREVAALVEAAAELLGTDAASVLVWLGRRAFAALACRYEELVAGYRSSSALLGHLDLVIHREVEKLYPDAHTPRFRIEETDDGLVVHYASDRGLIAFAVGMIQGAADHFGEVVTIERLDDGSDPRNARLRLRWVSAANPPDAQLPAA